LSGEGLGRWQIGSNASAYNFSGGKRDVREDFGGRIGLRANGGWADGGSSFGFGIFDDCDDYSLNIGANQGISIRRDLDSAE
jgi:hypothetical protein